MERDLHQKGESRNTQFYNKTFMERDAGLAKEGTVSPCKIFELDFNWEGLVKEGTVSRCTILQ